MNSSLSADRPQTDPAQDLFGYAPFAETLTKALCNYGSGDPLVLGLYGAWGSGKSTILKFICHNLEAMPEEERPIVIEFNPWWFSGQEHLARIFLGQIQAALPKKYAAFKKLGKLLGKYAEGIGEASDAMGLTGGWAKKLGALLKTLCGRPPEDIPTLKKKVCKELEESKSKKRIVIMIDDIDRLDAEEMRQLFTVIKALADFPNVIYLLAFDQDVVVRAIEKSSGMPGREYLEKIIQAPFVVPAIDRADLRSGLGKRLDKILEGTPEFLYDRLRWHSFFSDGIEYFFTVPRDVVRFCNTVSVTYPAVRGEVNAVDFIVIESIRFFLPKLYMYIRENPHEFVGARFNKDLPDIQLENILRNFVKSEKLRQCIKNILELLFPYIVNKDSLQKDEHRMLFVGGRKVFPRYFRFNIISDNIRNIDILQLLKKIEDAAAFGSVLLRVRELGLPEVERLLDRLVGHAKNDIQKKDIPVVIEALLDVGDDIIEFYDIEYGKENVRNCILIRTCIDILAKRIPLEQRLYMLEHAMQEGRALAIQCYLVWDSEKAIKEGRESLISHENLSRFRVLLLKKVDERISHNTLLEHRNLNVILYRCWQWDSEKIKNWCGEITKKYENMFLFIKKFFVTEYKSLKDGIRKLSYIRVEDMENYIDVADFESRILALQAEGKIPQEYEETANLFLQSVALWHEGKTPEDVL